MIDHLLRTEPTGMVYPNEVNCGVVAHQKLNDLGPSEFQNDGFSITKEYNLSLKVGVLFRSNHIQLPGREDQAKRQLKYELYKDVITDIHEALNSCQDTRTAEILSHLLDKVSS